jgi:pimeloyl-ACP methyl ester carboxylesterase
MAAPDFSTVTAAGADARWIVMVHGISQDRRVFSAQIDAFKADYRLLLIDLPGHGRSAAMPGPYGMTEFAAAIEAAMAAAGIERAHLWATHLGAASGLLLACRRPELFHSLVLEGPVYPGRAMPAVSVLLDRIAQTAAREGLEAARAIWWAEGGWFAVMRGRPEECRAAEHRAIVDGFQGGPWLDPRLMAPIPPVDEALARLAIPVLIVNGEHDMPGFIEAAAALAAILPDCRRARIKDGGGFPFWEFPARVNAEVERFLAAASETF